MTDQILWSIDRPVLHHRFTQNVLLWYCGYHAFSSLVFFPSLLCFVQDQMVNLFLWYLKHVDSSMVRSLWQFNPRSGSWKRYGSICTFENGLKASTKYETSQASENSPMMEVILRLVALQQLVNHENLYLNIENVFQAWKMFWLLFCVLSVLCVFVLDRRLVYGSQLKLNREFDYESKSNTAWAQK